MAKWLVLSTGLYAIAALSCANQENAHEGGAVARRQDAQWVFATPQSIVDRANRITGNPDKPIYGNRAHIGDEVAARWGDGELPGGWGSAHRLLRASARLRVLALHTQHADDLAAVMVKDCGWLRAELDGVSQHLATGGVVSNALMDAYLKEVSFGSHDGIEVTVNDVGEVRVAKVAESWSVVVPKRLAKSMNLRRRARHSGDYEVKPGGVGQAELDVGSVGSIRVYAEERSAAWPYDGSTILGSAEAGIGKADILISLRRCILDGDEANAGWAIRALARSASIDAELLRCTMRDYPWIVDELRSSFEDLWYCHGCWESFVAAILDKHAERVRVAKALADRDDNDLGEAYEALVGYWLATTGDSMALPSRARWLGGVPTSMLVAMLDGCNAAAITYMITNGYAGNDGVSRVHLHGDMDTESRVELIKLSGESVAAAMILAEAGDSRAARMLFQPVEEAMPAACDCLEGDLLECAWRSGWMPLLFAAAIDKGGYMIKRAKSWLGRNDLEYISDMEFASALRHVVDKGGVRGVYRSRLADTWIMVNAPR